MHVILTNHVFLVNIDNQTHRIESKMVTKQVLCLMARFTVLTYENVFLCDSWFICE